MVNIADITAKFLLIIDGDGDYGKEILESLDSKIRETYPGYKFGVVHVSAESDDLEEKISFANEAWKSHNKCTAVYLGIGLGDGAIYTKSDNSLGLLLSHKLGYDVKIMDSFKYKTKMPAFYLSLVKEDMQQIVNKIFQSIVQYIKTENITI